ALLIIPLFGSHLWATIYVGRFLQSNFGDAPTLLLPGIIISLLYALVFLLFEDGSRFFVHRAMHNVPFLWRLHRVHHSAEILTPLTLFRVHPLESIIYFLRGLFVFGLVSGVFIWLFGRELTFFHILGVDALGFIFNLAGANLRHSHIWLSFGRFENYFISPAQHQFHHSKDHGHPNFGTYLAFWDRINGSLKKTSPKPAHLKFGLGNGQYEDSISLAPQINQSVGT
ncbi:MAG: sterol desaturase family protein, partial [Pseudomonadota bacterium]|nr:sterol desaturase family protein [Pseudomonadota bacterium]